MQGAAIINGNEQEQREAFKRNAIANMAMEIAKAMAQAGALVSGRVIATEAIEAAETIFSYANTVADDGKRLVQ